MAQENFELEMSLLLDGLLDEDEEEALINQFDNHPRKAEAFSHMSLVDSILKEAPMVAPSVNFTASVMAGVERIERRRQIRPMLVGLIVVLSLTATFFLAAPWVIYLFDLYEPLLQIPAVGVLMDFFMQVFSAFGWLFDWVTDTIRDWLTLLATNPAAMAVVIGGLGFVSAWIGLREGVRAESTATVEA